MTGNELGFARPTMYSDTHPGPGLWCPRKPRAIESPNTSSVSATEPPPPDLLAAAFRLDLKGEWWCGPDQINEHRGTGCAPEPVFFRA